ncbi:MAG: acyloxyacyl hydrolase [Rhodobacteraceae bacterium]|nr:acyloxyacyl hydrolase [Paracoccaceae bacterium]TVR48287.1 MAG: acyloxyacyl hydrolase [Paracoccaceae bacterium]
MALRGFILSTALVFCAAAPLQAESARVTVALGQQLGPDSPELQLRYSGDPVLMKLQPVIGLSVAANGSVWLGAGIVGTWRAPSNGMFLRGRFMPGAYRQGRGRDLSGPMQFRSSLEMGFQRADGLEYGIGADHRSSAGLHRPNPGLDSLFLFASFPY